MLRPIESEDLQLLPFPGLRLYLRQVVFGDGEDHGDRLNLGDDNQGRRPVRLNHVAGINEA